MEQRRQSIRGGGGDVEREVEWEMECETPDVEEHVGLFELHWQCVIVLHGEVTAMV